jgi:hypothetical protein
VVLTGDLRHALAAAVAEAYVAGGEWMPDAMVERAVPVIGRSVRTRRLAELCWRAYPIRPVDRPRELTAFVASSPLLPDKDSAGRRLVVRERHPTPVRHGALRWPVPPLDTVADLARWLGLDDDSLAWYADPQRRLVRSGTDDRLRHYRFRWVPKRSGGWRLLECPKWTLKELQRRVLDGILAAVPAHQAAHGFVTGRSAITHARLHVGQPTVVRFDLRHFFSAVTAGRVYGIFRSIGYAEPVAHLLAGLVTTTTPAAVRRSALMPADPEPAAAHRWLLARLGTGHLPQGAPTSPALANLCAYRLDARLDGLAASTGATYSRYADDLTFSGPVRVPSLVRTVRRICVEEGFRLNERKTVVAPVATRQLVTGVVVNVRTNAARSERDRLRAILHDARLHGLDAANRDGRPDFAAHVLGRIAWVSAANPEHGAKLRAEFDAL